MTKLVNRAKMTTATTGTGTITLGSAVDGFQSFTAAGVVDGDVVRYVIEDGTAFEIGTAVYGASGTTLARTVSESSNAGAPINLSGSAVVFVGATAEDFFSAPVPAEWVRSPSWLELTAPGVDDEKFVGLHAVWPDSNFLALSAEGNYTVDWGDGSATENFSSGVVAYKEYDFNDADLANTNAPVTFTASTNTINRTAHGYSNGNRVSFFNIVTTTGLNEAQSYYVINAAADTFQVSETEGGSAVALTNDGIATLLPYKQVIVQVYPQAGQSLTQLNLHQKHNKAGLQAYASGFLDIAVASANLTDLRIGVATPGSTTANINFNLLERVNLVRTDCRQLDNLFFNCRSLQNVVDIATSITAANLNIPVTFTDAGNVVGATAHGFRNGDSVVFSVVNTTTGIFANIRYFVINANVNDFQVSNTYGGSALTLTNNGTGNAIRGTSMGSQFSGCSSLTTVPLFDTSSVTNMLSMFQSCSSLTTVPLFDTSSVTIMQSMFSACFSLTTVPLFDTSSVTNVASMFSACFSLTTVPLFDTSSVTNMQQMFQSCSSLTTVPLFDTSSVTNMLNMFLSCSSLSTLPAFNLSNLVTTSNMFNNCPNLSQIKATGFAVTFSVANCKLSAVALDEIYTNLATVSSGTITVTGNHGTDADDPTIATAKGWTVTG